ncbi:hypothetical protein RFI_30698, partial [Reticulomyxa filosa]
FLCPISSFQKTEQKKKKIELCIGNNKNSGVIMTIEVSKKFEAAVEYLSEGKAKSNVSCFFCDHVWRRRKKNRYEQQQLQIHRIAVSQSYLIKQQQQNVVCCLFKKKSRIPELKQMMTKKKKVKAIVIGQNPTQKWIPNVKTRAKPKDTPCTNLTFAYESTLYNLKFMDTPGLGDVEGIEKDDEHVQNILDTISKTPEVSCRLTYVITKPNWNDSKHLSTKFDCIRPNLDIKILFSTSIPAEHVFYMNNEIFSIDPKNSNERDQFPVQDSEKKK